MKLKQLEWMAGNWRNQALGGTAEEHWQVPSGGSMLGSFKLVVDEKVKFYPPTQAYSVGLGTNLPARSRSFASA